MPRLWAVAFPCTHTYSENRIPTPTHVCISTLNAFDCLFTSQKFGKQFCLFIYISGHLTAAATKELKTHTRARLHNASGLRWANAATVILINLIPQNILGSMLNCNYSCGFALQCKRETKSNKYSLQASRLSVLCVKVICNKTWFVYGGWR